MAEKEKEVATETVTPSHNLKDGLKGFVEKKTAPSTEVKVVEDVKPQQRDVQAVALESGFWRVGPEWYSLVKGQIVVLPEEIRDYFRSLRKVE